MSEGSNKDNNTTASAAALNSGFNELIAAAHELKTPLAIISQLAASIDDDLLMATPLERKVTIDRIRLSAERTLRLVQGLTVSHRLAQSDQLAFQFMCEPVNSQQICEEVIQEIAPFAAAYSQVIELRSHTLKSQLVLGNRELLRSVFFNLLDNAIKHNPPGTAIVMNIRRRATMVRICIQDNGPGLKPHALHSLRQTIGKELQPLHGRAGTSGLGLYIAAQMASAMGGRLGLGSLEADHGVDLHIDLLCSNQLSLL